MDPDQSQNKINTNNPTGRKESSPLLSPLSPTAISSSHEDLDINEAEVHDNHHKDDDLINDFARKPTSESSRMRNSSPQRLRTTSNTRRGSSVSPTRGKHGSRPGSVPGSISGPSRNNNNNSISSNSGNLTIWDYLMLEVTNSGAETLLGEEKTEHLFNVVKIPIYLERAVLFGMLTCLDSFLHAFTVLPLRVFYAVYKFLSGSGLNSSRRTDLIKGFILCFTFSMVLNLDTSRIYHSIRGQAAIKLYVMFNVLEIADKLCAALGQDIMECLFTMSVLDQHKKTLIFTVFTLIYCYVHSLVLLYQIVSLNVAVNSYSNALITLLLSNQFSEIKGTVFKKFERESLFQLTCADITERFQLVIMLLVVGVRNVVEVSNIGIIPTSWSGWNRWLGALLGPAIVVVGSEIMVDWLKHAYIAKFNNLGARVYRKFLDVLAVDYAENAFSDQRVTRRTGLPVYALAAVSAKMILQSYYILLEIWQAADMLSTNNTTNTTHTQAATPSTANVLDKIDRFFDTSSSYSISSTAGPWMYKIFHMSFIILSLFLVAISVKLVLGMLLLRYASKRRATLKAMKYRARTKSGVETGDYIFDKSMAPGMVKLEDSTRKGLYEPEESAPEAKSVKVPDMSVGDLFTITRFKMVAKRIW